MSTLRAATFAALTLVLCQLTTVGSFARGLGDVPNCGGAGQVACTIAEAKYLGKKPEGCPKGSFFDPIDGGGCWTCPSGTTRNVTSVKSESACLRGPRETTARAVRHGRGKGLLGTDCPRGQFWDPKGNCYSCPSGFTRTAAPVTANNACTKWHGPSTAPAKKTKSLACPDNGFFDPIRGGTCWSCPANYVRTLSDVRSDNACASNLAAGVHPLLGQCKNGLVNIRGRCQESGVCGALGQRPCTIAERLPSCNSGLAEDFVAHRCVEDVVGKAICTATVDAIWAGKDLSGLLGKVSMQALRSQFRVPVGDIEAFKDRLQQQAMGELTNQLKKVVPEVEHIADWMNAPQNAPAVREAFSSRNVCRGNARDLDRLLLDLNLVPQSVIDDLGLDAGDQRGTTGIPVWSAMARLFGGAEAHAQIPPGDPQERHFYMGYELTLSAAKVAGAGISIMGVTDFRGNGGFYIAPLLQMVTNVTGDFDARVVFFSSANMQTFEGFGFGLGASGTAKGAVSAGADLILDDRLTLRGFGFGPGVGKGKLPGDIGIQGSHAWQITRHCADADADTTTDCGDCHCID